MEEVLEKALQIFRTFLPANGAGRLALDGGFFISHPLSLLFFLPGLRFTQYNLTGVLLSYSPLFGIKMHL